MAKQNTMGRQNSFFLEDDLDFYREYFSEPKSRADICDLFNTHDVTARQYIAKLQNLGLNIVNLQNGRGYYIPKDAKAVAEYAKQEINRGLACIVKGYKMIKRCGQENQIDINELIEQIESEVK